MTQSIDAPLPRSATRRAAVALAVGIIALPGVSSASPAPSTATTRTPTGREQRAAAAAAAREACPRLAALAAAARAEPESARRASDYRQAVILCGDHERAFAFFAALAAAHPRSANVALNQGYAHVDAIPTAGAIHRVVLADRAIDQFTRAIELAPSWLALFTRGNAYLYWPKVFGRLPLALADLERAAAMARSEGVRPYQVRGWVALGDAHWKDGRPERARAAWQEGVALFGTDPRLAARLAADGEALAALVESDLDPAKRVDTDLSMLEPAP